MKIFLSYGIIGEHRAGRGLLFSSGEDYTSVLTISSSTNKNLDLVRDVTENDILSCCSLVPPCKCKQINILKGQLHEIKIAKCVMNEKVLGVTHPFIFVTLKVVSSEN